jgi:hypothetical protein
MISRVTMIEKSLSYARMPRSEPCGPLPSSRKAMPSRRAQQEVIADRMAFELGSAGIAGAT